MRDVARRELLDCITDLRLYLHQRYGLPLKGVQVARGSSSFPRKRPPSADGPPPSAARDVSAIASSTNLRRTPLTVLTPDPSAPPVDLSAFRTMSALAEHASDCRLCGLCAERTQVVFGAGAEKPKIMIIGEAPGAEEDLQGKPFVGRAGQMLTKILNAVHVDRDRDVFITNVVKCRPPGNRNPKPDEISACAPFLRRQIELLKPSMILALGTFAAQTLLKSTEPIMRLRGREYSYEGVPLIVTLHPAACLYNPSNKVFVWEDVKAIPERLAPSAR